MAKTFYILGEVQPKHPNELKIVVGRGVLAPASEAVHAANVRLRRLVAFHVTGASITTAGTVVSSRLSPRIAAAAAYASINPAPRNFASIVVQPVGAGTISFEFLAFGD